MDHSRRALWIALASALPLLAACGGGGPLGPTAATPPPAPAAPAVSAEALVGKWGLASYHKDEDRARTLKEAKAQCNKPYVVKAGPGGGVMMHLADQKDPQELVLKAGAEGKTFLGPPGDPGGGDDRIVSDVDPNSFTTVWIDPDTANRYGTMVYMRCGAR